MTKKCKSCQSDIDVKAKKCPHCQTDQRNWFRRHPILTGLLVLIILGFIGSFSTGGSNAKKEPNSGSVQTAGSNNSNTEDVEAAIKIDVKELADDFDSNQVAAEEKWKGKNVEFKAEITNITDTGLSFSKIASKQFSLTQISCRVKDKQQIFPLKNGQTVTVRGIVGGQTIGVIDVSSCEVI